MKMKKNGILDGINELFHDFLRWQDLDETERGDGGFGSTGKN